MSLWLAILDLTGPGLLANKVGHTHIHARTTIAYIIIWRPHTKHLSLTSAYTRPDIYWVLLIWPLKARFSILLFNKNTMLDTPYWRCFPGVHIIETIPRRSHSSLFFISASNLKYLDLFSFAVLHSTKPRHQLPFKCTVEYRSEVCPQSTPLMLSQ